MLHLFPQKHCPVIEWCLVNDLSLVLLKAFNLTLDILSVEPVNATIVLRNKQCNDRVEPKQMTSRTKEAGV